MSIADNSSPTAVVPSLTVLFRGDQVLSMSLGVHLLFRRLESSVMKESQEGGGPDGFVRGGKLRRDVRAGRRPTSLAKIILSSSVFAHRCTVANLGRC